jgi:hypothetical protein
MNGDDTVYQNDPAIESGDPIWRRVPPGRWTYDHNEGRVRPASGNFTYSTDKETRTKHPMSITLGKGLTPDQALAGYDNFKLVGWGAGHIRTFELGVCPDDNGVPGHGLVFTLKMDQHGKRRTNIASGVSDQLSLTAEWIVTLSVDEVEEARLRTAEPASGG